MKKLLLWITPVIVSFSTYAQTQNNNSKFKTTQLDEEGLPLIIKMNQNASFRKSDASQAMREALKLGSNQSMKKMNSSSDGLGYTHEKYQMYHNNIKVEHSWYTVHSKNDKVESMTGDICKIKNAKSTPTLSANQALLNATKYIGAKSYLWDNKAEAKELNYSKPTGELVYLPNPETKEINLVYKFDIYATQPLSRGYVYIDANNGKIVLYDAIIKHLGEHSYGNVKDLPKGVYDEHTDNTSTKMAYLAGQATTRYNGVQSIETTNTGSGYILYDQTRGNGIMTLNMKTPDVLDNQGLAANNILYSTALKFVDNDNVWNEYNNTAKDNAALDAHWGITRTYDYFLNRHGRKSYDDNNSVIKNYVHFDYKLNNAFWNGTNMSYGDGDDKLMNALTSLDVTAHEFAHAVCERTAGLVYQGESGALNEGLSDIWAACIENAYMQNANNWLIGEQIMSNPATKAALRSMKDPGLFDQPNYYGDAKWIVQNCTTFESKNDYCGVHTNSSILNRWFYILVNGTSPGGVLLQNLAPGAPAVNGITIADAAKIVYRMESIYFTPRTNYQNARAYAIQAATDLFGAASAQTTAVTNAFTAVGVGTGTTNNLAINPVISLEAGTVTNTKCKLRITGLGAVAYTITMYSNDKVVNASNFVAVTGVNGAYTFDVTLTAGTLNNLKAKVALSTDANQYKYTNQIAVQTTACNSQGSSVAYMNIKTVTMAGVTRNSVAGETGYTNNSAIVFTTQRSRVYPITITPNYPNNTAYNEFYAAWIDYNDDNFFDDTTEKTTIQQNVITTANVVGNITIDANAKLGKHKMRIAQKYSALPTSCEIFSYGEVEDYTINVTEADIDMVAPPMPTALTITGSTWNTISASWTHTTAAANGVIGYNVYTRFYDPTTNALKVGPLRASTNTTSITVKAYPGLRCDITVAAVDANNNSSAETAPVSRQFAAVDTPVLNAATRVGTTNSITLSWSIPAYVNNVTTYHVFINGAFFNTVKGATTTTINNLVANTQYNYIIIGERDNEDNLKYTIQSNTVYYTLPAAVPVVAGSTTMKLDSSDGGNNTAIKIYPNPVNDVLNVVNSIHNETEYTIKNTAGKIIMQGKLADSTIPVEQLSQGMYFIELTDSQNTLRSKFLKM